MALAGDMAPVVCPLRHGLQELTLRQKYGQNLRMKLRHESTYNEWVSRATRIAANIVMVYHFPRPQSAARTPPAISRNASALSSTTSRLSELI